MNILATGRAARGVRRGLASWSAVALAGVLILQACSSPTAQGPTSGQTTGPTSGTVPASPTSADCTTLFDSPAAAAKQAYDLAAAGQDTLPVVTTIVQCLGVRIVPISADDSTIKAVATSAEPTILDLELAAAAAGFKSGILFDLDSVVADLRDKGVSSKADGQPVTREAFDAAIAAAAASDKPINRIPRLLVAFSQERASRTGVAPVDPEWGDPTFDSLQMLLFFLCLDWSSRPASASSTSHVVLADWPAVAEIGNFVDIATFLKDLLTFPNERFTVCSQVIGFYTSFKMTWSNAIVWHRNGRQPDTNKLQGELLLDHQFTSRESAVLDLIGCTPPAQSGLANKQVQWFLDAAAQEHGSLIRQDATTGAGGVATADYQTIDETTPEAQQTPDTEQKAAVRAEVQVTNLLPDFPGFSAIFRAVHGTSANNLASPSGAAPFDVHWYQPLGYTVVLDWEEQYKDGHIDEGHFEGVIGTVEPCAPDGPKDQECIMGTGTVTGSRGGWASCSQSMTTPSGSGPAEFHAVIEGDVVTVTAFAVGDNVLIGMNTLPIGVPKAGGHVKDDKDYETYCGADPATHKLIVDITLTPVGAP